MRACAAAGVTVVLLAAAAGCSRQAGPRKPPTLFPVWDLAAKQLVPDALSQLPPGTDFDGDAGHREADYARAMLLLNAQPKTQGNIAEAARLLESLRSGAKKPDATGRKAVFALARVAQWHASPPDPNRAMELYAELSGSGDDPLAQAARVQQAELRLFAAPLPRDDAGLRARLESLEAEANALTRPAALRDYHLLMASGYRELAADSAKPELLRHLLAAESAGARRQTRLNLCAEIGELARRLGRNEIAVEHFRGFLAISSRDLRTALIRRQLQELEAAAAGTAPKS